MRYAFENRNELVWLGKVKFLIKSQICRGKFQTTKQRLLSSWTILVPERFSAAMTSYTSLLFVFAQVFFCCPGGRRAYVSAHITEEYTVWPKDNASRLPEDYPWPCCDKRTGRQCPGLIDYLEYFCTREDNQGCQKRNESVSERHVLLNLLPGQHKMDLWETFSGYASIRNKQLYTQMAPDFFWFCRVSVTFQGSGLSKTTILTGSEVAHDQQKYTNSPVCHLERLYSLQPSFWSVFAFRGGGNIAFQDIAFQTSYSPGTGSKYRFQAIIAVWDLAILNIKNCTFELVFPQRAVAAFYSAEADRFSISLENSEFHSNIASSSFPTLPSPLVLIKSLRHAQPSSNVNQIRYQTLAMGSRVLVRGSIFKSHFKDTSYTHNP